MQQVYFSRLNMPDNLGEVETVEFIIRWEVSYAEGEREKIDSHSYDEINELLTQKVAALLKDKGADVARIVQSSVHHKTKYEPYASEISGDYRAILYKFI
jgi:hypothetical protein